MSAEIDRLTFALSDARMEIATLKDTRDELVKALEESRDAMLADDPTGWAAFIEHADAVLEKAKQP